MQWTPLTQLEQLADIVRESAEHPVVIFKHSTSCSISAMAKTRLERQWPEADLGPVKAYYLDLLRYRPISSEIAKQFGVHHESPQLLLIRNGECHYNASHMSIQLGEVKRQVL
ncbi:bacillithiol system redox-active protein YtxJ [Hymenobacter busanensis]|uniref:Bacillithiol system redox-active protein YtxJ n=1 Tax=Hymenobacter busanensis TaxID=2607656 RepID=A0A7L4ZYT9_9BACT|nr:bacillithiol system redox-active protein YtxJ [Hymenobacter busanensis]KAA9333220.1 bacillithiol system redox-active protein YtxJ [Hymenobacter busanensis]QHJ08103.1 bacillithiol system redox-active protein YtxJ [Hymenobacter busanensis]